MNYEKLELLVMEYCKRHDIQLKYTKRFPAEKVFEAEGVAYDLLEARLNKSGRLIFKHDGKRTSIYK